MSAHIIGLWMSQNMGKAGKLHGDKCVSAVPFSSYEQCVKHFVKECCANNCRADKLEFLLDSN